MADLVTLRALDLFAGPGGWDVGAAALGIDALGIEFDDAACATREAAGHRTLQADVSELDPLAFGPVDLLIASPPCQAWSLAGKRGGAEDIERVYALTAALAAEEPTDELDADWTDARSELVVEPLRWALTLRPRFLAFEQVPPVLDYWRHVAELLRREDYGVWAGILECERYGVPQTRERAILMAELNGNPHPPTPTHQRYMPGEPARHEITLEGELRPWVSMAEALGWRTGSRAMDPRQSERAGALVRPDSEPSRTICAEKLAKGVDVWRVGSPRADDQGGDGYRERDFRDEDEPAFTVTEKARSAIKLRAGSQPNQAVRDIDEPAPTIIGGHDTARRVWTADDDASETPPRGTHMAKNEDRAERKAQGAGNRPRSVDAPAATLDTRTDLAQWTDEQPAPTIVTTRRSDEGIIVGRKLPDGEGRNVGGHGYLDTHQSNAKARPTDEPAPAMVGQNLAKGAAVFTDDPATETTEGTGYKPTKGVRVSEVEAAVLQGFPRDYPWQGSRTKKFQQIGNAVPPPLAAAVLRALLDKVSS